MGTFVTAVGGKAGGYARLQFEAPVLSEPERATYSEPAAPEGALQTMVPNFRIESEREPDVADIVVRIDKVRTDEPTIKNATRPPADLRDHGEIAPATRVILHIPIPREPARPGLETGTEADADLVSDLEVHPDVGLGQPIPEKVGPDGKFERRLNAQGIYRHRYNRP